MPDGSMTLLLGGARSGKTSLALRLARQHAERLDLGVTYVATGPTIAGDDDWARRVQRHRDERPDHWRTVEAPHDLAAGIAQAGNDVVIVDCLTLWVGNLLWTVAGRAGLDGIEDIDDPDAAVAPILDDAIEAALTHPSSVIVVSNEVGLGIHPAAPAGRVYRDVLGRVNQRWAAVSDPVQLVMAGRVLDLQPPT